MAANGLPDEDAEDYAEQVSPSCPRCEETLLRATQMVLAATDVSAEEIQRLRLELAAANAEVVLAATEASVEEIVRLRLELTTAKALLMSTSTRPFGLSVEQDRALRACAGEMKAEMAKDCLIVGKVYRHPTNDRLLRVTDGSYLGGYERVSNFWYWSYLDEAFSPTGNPGQGYGWAAKPIEEPVPCDHCGVHPNQESDAEDQNPNLEPVLAKIREDAKANDVGS